jgi:hypothetical protein
MGMRDSKSPGIHANKVRVEDLHHLAGDDSGYVEKALCLLLRKVVPPGIMPF